MKSYKKVPRHIGIIPDGNRRWAQGRGMGKQEGYRYGVVPGVGLFGQLREAGVREASFFGFTQDNTKRPAEQKEAFSQACVEAVRQIGRLDADILVLGNADSPAFPGELREFAGRRVQCGKGGINVNFLINYDWKWDLKTALRTGSIASHLLPRMELIIRWGGRRRLSGFLPVQSVYADIYVLEELWPDYCPEHFWQAMDWYQTCDTTLGG